MEIKSIKEHSLYRALLDASPDAMVIVDAHGIILHTNTQTEKLFGYKENELAGQAVEILIPAALHQAHTKHRENFAKHPHVKSIVTGSSLEVIKKDGTKFSVEISLSPLKTDEGFLFLASIRDASVHKFAENKLLQLSQAVEQSPASVIITDTEGTIQYANQKFMDVTGYGPEDVIGKNPRILKSGHTSETDYAELWKYIASGQQWQGEFHNKKKNGELYWEKALIAPILDAKGKIINFLAIKEDITEQKKAEKELAEKEFFLRESQKAGNIGSYKTNFLIGYWQSSETLDGIFGIDKNYDRNIEGWLGVVHPDDKQKMEEYLRLEVIGKRKSFNKEYRIKRINDKQTRWVWGLGNVKFDYSGNVTELIGTIQDITERKRTEDDLAELNQFNKQIIESAQDGIIVYDLNMRFLAWNPFMEKITGMPASQVLGKHASDLFPFLQTAGVIENIKKALSGEIDTTPDFYFSIPGSGLSGWAFDTTSPLKNSKGEIIGVLSIVRDITERKKAEESLFKSQQNYKNLLENMNDGFMVDDISGKITFVNKRFLEIFDLNEDDINDLTIEDFIAPDYLMTIRNRHNQRIAGTKVADIFEFEGFRKNGDKIWLEVRVKQIYQDGTITGTQSVIRDITEQKKAEKKLVEKEFFLRESQKAGNIGSYKTNFVTGDWQSSETLDSIFGIDKNYERSIAGWVGIVHPDDSQKMEEYLLLEVIGKRKSFNKEYRITRINDKQTRWVLGMGDVYFDDSGNVTELIGTIQDITERKNVEELLNQSEMNLRTIFENTNTGFYLLDIDGNIISFNRKVNEFAKLSFGFELQEKKNLLLMFSPERRRQFLDMRSEILSGSNFYNEINYPQTDGAIIWYSVNANLVYDLTGKVFGVCVTVNDITERKKAEDKISESEETFRRLFIESADPILLLDDTGFIECNQAAASILGYSSPKEVLIKHPWEISPEKQPDGRLSTEKAVEMISEAQQNGFNRFEWIHTKTDGTEFPVDVMLTPIILKGKQFFYTIWRDISERKKAEEELRASNERFEFVNKATQDTIWEWDFLAKKGKWGEGITTTFGYSKDQLTYIEHWHNEFVHPLDKERVRNTLELCKRERKVNWQDEFRFRCADGTYKYVIDRGFFLFDDQGKVYRMIGAMTDVTEKKKLERKLIQQQIKEQKLITEVTIQSQEKEKNELGKELHDNINQILATVKMYLGMVKAKENNSEDLVEKCYEYVTVAMGEIRKLSHSLVAPSLGDIGLHEALMELIDEINVSNNLEVELIDEIKNDLHIDKKMELMLYRIIQEQMNNIIKYAQAKKAAISLKKDGDTLRLTILDYGVGFDTTMTKKGIGLKNIHSRVEFFSGKMKIITAPGQGCRLEITFPVNNKTEPL